MRLLDLPDEILDLLVEGRLTEGHGRALLTAPDHADRRRLGRAAADEGWTVRETEARARETARPPEVAPKPRRAIHPDQIAAAERLQDAFSTALGADVRVAPAARATPSRSRSTPWRPPKPSQSGYHSAPQRAISSVG